MERRDPQNAGVSIDAMTSVDHLHAVAPAWDTLLEGSPSCNIFLTWEWMAAWLDIFGLRGEPFVLAVTDADGSLRGLAPLFSTHPRRGPLAVRVLRFLGTGVGADHMGFIWPPGQDLTERILLRLLDEDGKWDVFDFAWMDGDQARRAVQAVERHRRTHTSILTETAKCPVLQLPSAWDPYVKTLSPSFRSGLRRSRLRLDRDHGPVEFLQVATEDEFDTAWEALISFHQARWRSRGLQGAFADPFFKSFHRRFGAVALRKGWLRFHVLRVREEIAATLYCFRFGSRICYFQGSFNPAWSRYGPGRLLMAHAIRSAIEEEAAEFDFLRGTERHKMHWRPRLRSDYHLAIFRRHPRISAAVVWADWVRHAHRLARPTR